jgi:threonine dehydratase
MARITLADIEQAQARIAGHVLRTPLMGAEPLSRELGVLVRLKPEILQETGSFKLRGATNAMLSLDAAARARGVVTASSGNHGPALACAATRLGVSSTICLSEMVPQNKIANVRANGGAPKVEGRDYAESLKVCMGLVENEGRHLVHPFDDPAVVAGAGTTGLEIAEDGPGLDCALVPVSGGGLLAGVATAINARSPATRVIGVSMERGASMAASLKAGKPVEVQELETIADALGGNIGLDNQWTFETVHSLVDDCITLTEDEIKSAMRLIFHTQGLMVEGSGAVGIAALMTGKVTPCGPVACVLSRRNIAPGDFLDIVNRKGAPQ